jgi:hypothetical protein
MPRFPFPLALALAACSSSSTAPSTSTSAATTATTSSTGAGGGGGATGAGGGGGATGAGGSGGTASAGGAGGAPTTSSAGGAGGSAPIAACKDIGATDCFSSYDCPAADRCENRGTEAAPVPCCVPGARGKGKAGDPCSGEADCESALCVDGKTCTSKCASAAECPASLPKCIPIALSGSNDLFCAP